MFKKSNEEPVRIGNQVSSIKQDFNDDKLYPRAFAPVASPTDYYMALAYTVRDRLMDRWTKTAKTYLNKASRTICYLSAEFAWTTTRKQSK